MRNKSQNLTKTIVQLAEGFGCPIIMAEAIVAMMVDEGIIEAVNPDAPPDEILYIPTPKGMDRVLSREPEPENPRGDGLVGLN